MLLEGYTAGSGERTISASVSIVTGSETDPFLGSYHLFSRGAPVYFLSTHQQS